MSASVDEVPVAADRLTAKDRCDRCGSQAFAKTTHGTSDLLWCAHHYGANKKALAGFVVIDETARLVIDEANRLT